MTRASPATERAVMSHEADIIPFPERPEPADEVAALTAALAYHEQAIERHLRVSEEIREELGRLGINATGEQAHHD